MSVNIDSLRKLFVLAEATSGTGGSLEIAVALAEAMPEVLDELESLRAEHAACRVVQTLENAPCPGCGNPDLRMIGAFGPVCPNCGAGIDQPIYGN